MIMLTVQVFSLGLFLQFLSVYSGPPFIADSCGQNCTLASHLPCQVKTFDMCPLDDVYVGTLWPAAPDQFAVSVTYDLLDDHCFGRLWFEWTPPNDSSGKSVRGFQLEVISMSGTYMNTRICVNFDLTRAKWRDEDIKMKPLYTYSCVLAGPGVYYASIYSLPKPELGADDKLSVIDNIHVPKAYPVSGTCKIPQTTPPSPVVHHHTAPPYPSHNAPVSVRMTETETADGWTKWLGVGLGIGAGVLIVITGLVITVICVKHGSRSGHGSGSGRGSRSGRGSGSSSDPEYIPRSDPDHTSGGEGGIWDELDAARSPSPTNDRKHDVSRLLQHAIEPYRDPDLYPWQPPDVKVYADPPTLMQNPEYRDYVTEEHPITANHLTMMMQNPPMTLEHPPMTFKSPKMTLECPPMTLERPQLTSKEPQITEEQLTSSEDSGIRDMRQSLERPWGGVHRPNRAFVPPKTPDNMSEVTSIGGYIDNLNRQYSAPPHTYYNNLKHGHTMTNTSGLFKGPKALHEFDDQSTNCGSCVDAVNSPRRSHFH